MTRFAMTRFAMTGFATIRFVRVLTVLSIVAGVAPAVARTLQVGPDHALQRPSEAARVARDGDTVEIEPGLYNDCAIWTANRLLIVGKGEGPVITGPSCQGKGLFVVSGSDMTIHNVTLRGARVRDGNGAGLRFEGRNLTIRRSRFADNENGVLTSRSPDSHVVVLDSEFIANGSCRRACAHGIYVGIAASLRVERSRFADTRVAHHIKSRARQTVLIGNDIRDGAGDSSYLVDIPNGGTLVMIDNTLEKGPRTSNPLAAIVVGAEGVRHPIGEFRLTGNRFSNRLPHPTIFLLNMTETPALLEGNDVSQRTKQLVGPGKTP